MPLLADEVAQDHPRVCGEHGARSRPRRFASGSPPRVRGTPHPAVPSRRGGGITPACAGNTASSWSACCLRRDHPRVCGEHVKTMFVKPNALGSPPRVRGTPRPRHRARGHTGITPACAGNTSARHRRPQRRTDHPRVCGEHVDRRVAHADGRGSPPRVRGTRTHPTSGSVASWITPACAGNTPLIWRGDRDDPDHPRVCGEHTC